MINKFMVRLFFRYFSFFQRIEKDETLSFFKASLAISIILAIYTLAILGLILKNTSLFKYLNLNTTIFFEILFSIIMILVFNEKRKIIIKGIKNERKDFKFVDVLIWLFLPIACYTHYLYILMW